MKWAITAAVFIIILLAAAMFKYEHLHDREAAIEDCKAAGQELVTQEPCTELRYHHTRQR